MLQGGKGESGGDDDRVGDRVRRPHSSGKTPERRRKRRRPTERGSSKSHVPVEWRLPWVKVSCFSTATVSREEVIRGLDMTILGKRLKIVHCRNCLFFVPKDNKDFHRVLVEKSVKIGRKTYQAHPASPEDDPDFPKSAVDDRKKKNKVSGPSMVEVAPSFGTSSAAVRPSQLFIGKDEKKGVTPTHELLENSGSALRVDGKLFLRMLERVEVLETNIAKIAHVIDREASSSQSSNVSEPLDVDRSDVVGSATVQTDIADYLTKGKDSNSPLYSLQALYPEELYDTVFPVLSQPLLRLLRTYASRDPELKDCADPPRTNNVGWTLYSKSCSLYQCWESGRSITYCREKDWGGQVDGTGELPYSVPSGDLVPRSTQNRQSVRENIP